MTDDVRAAAATMRRIPSGLWQRVVGGILFAIAIFASLAATPFNSAGTAAVLAFAAGGPLLFWGVILLYLSTLDRKIDRLLGVERPEPPTGLDRTSWIGIGVAVAILLIVAIGMMHISEGPSSSTNNYDAADVTNNAEALADEMERQADAGMTNDGWQNP